MNANMTSPVLRNCFCLLRHPRQPNIQFNKYRFDLVTSSRKISSVEIKKPKTTDSRFYQSNHRKLPVNNRNVTLNRQESQISSVLSSDKNDPDTFGTLSDDWKLQQQLSAMPEEEDDTVEREFLFNKEGKTRLTISQYAKIMKEFISQKKISLAIDVLETRMLKEDRAKPDNYIYNLLITACGQVGYTKKAFQLYNMMKERGLKVTGHTYTGLFNACANSPFPEESLKQALHLRGIMIEKAVLMNQTIYHAMIKAFGRCGDLETAFLLVDEMLEKKIKVTDETFNFLLQACISDKAAGFRHALLVWWKMMQKRVKPNLFSFNLLLRCSRDCGLGDEKSTQQVIQVLLCSGQENIKVPLLNSEAQESTNKGKLLAVTNSTESVPNLISQRPTMGSVIAVTNITQPEHRLMLMGGCKGVLEQMARFKVKPDVKTFTQMLDQLPSTLQAEQELLTAVSETGVSFDVDFCNMLIRKRCLRGDYENAKSVLKMISDRNLRPDMMTFGVLAMTCQTQTLALQLIQDINNLGLRPNVEILGTLLKNACYLRDCAFVMEVMKILKKEDLKPNEQFLKHLENFFRFASKVMSDQKTDDSGKLNQNDFFKFREYYKSWRQKIVTETPPHPWSQFQEVKPEPEDTELLNLGKVKYRKG
uniref:PROP1-like PPR domain-containing protein n=1 Tax=Cuerna arida TaxID=1464854 RepID=A0A1B6FRY6_9HEMI